MNTYHDVVTDLPIQIFRLESNNKWQASEVLGGHTDVVTDVAWAPNIGRSYQLLATASKDGHVRIFKMAEESGRGAGPGNQPGWQQSASSAVLGGSFAPKGRKKY